MPIGASRRIEGYFRMWLDLTLGPAPYLRMEDGNLRFLSDGGMIYMICTVLREFFSALEKGLGIG